MRPFVQAFWVELFGFGLLACGAATELPVSHNPTEAGSPPPPTSTTEAGSPPPPTSTTEAGSPPLPTSTAELMQFYVDAADPQGAMTPGPLAGGVTYQVQIKGTISAWSAQQMEQLCVGTPDPAPEFASPGTTGPASVDAEWVWAWPVGSASLCTNGMASVVCPHADRGMRVALSGSAQPSLLPPPVETEMTSNHTYTYRVVGEDTPAVFLVEDTNYADNYGQLLVTVTAE